MAFKLFRRMGAVRDKAAIVWKEGEKNYEVNYKQLLGLAQHQANNIQSQNLNSSRVQCSSPQSQCTSTARVALLDVGQIHYVSSLLGTWMAGHAIVPLCTTHPTHEWEYVLDDSECNLSVCHSSFNSTFQPLAKSRNIPCLQADCVPLDKITGYSFDESKFESPPLDNHAVTIYTSGTTGRPKGAVHSFHGIQSVLESLTEAWEWSDNDYILNFLPLHHVHGLENIVLNSLWAGATVEMMTRFNAKAVWEAIMSQPKLTVFMAVPTIYSKLIQEYDLADKETQVKMSEGCKRLRLMVSGSMALPIPLLNRWQEISSHVLLERYGMTEIGMALSNPLNGTRVPGEVGTPLPGVTAKILSDKEEGQGELLIKSENMFCGYYKKPELTMKEFTDDHWFKTGDIATCNAEGNYKILGRSSVDILKVGGFKISALDIERVFLSFPDIKECAVVGKDDLEYGQKICLVAAFKGESPTLESLRNWAKEYLPHYQLPTILIPTNEIPKNAMGKVNKKTLLSDIEK